MKFLGIIFGLLLSQLVMAQSARVLKTGEFYEDKDQNQVIVCGTPAAKDQREIQIDSKVEVPGPGESSARSWAQIQMAKKAKMECIEKDFDFVLNSELSDLSCAPTKSYDGAISAAEKYRCTGKLKITCAKGIHQMTIAPKVRVREINTGVN